MVRENNFMSKIEAKDVFFNIIDNTAVTIVINGKADMIRADHRNYNAIVEAIEKGNFDVIPDLISVGAKIDNFFEGNVRYSHGALYYNDIVLDGALINKALEFVETGNQSIYGRYIKFIDKLYQNPSMNSVKQLVPFLNHKGLPIAEDGDFLAYKSIQNDYMSKTAGKDGQFVDNSIGRVVTMPRWMIDDNPNTHCSQGLHAGALSYVKGYFCSGNDRIVIVKINPRDVVSVPSDYGCSKLRVCRYEVIADFEGELEGVTADITSLYTHAEDDESEAQNEYEDDYDSEYDEDDYEED
jgi:hypothetical protein